MAELGALTLRIEENGGGAAVLAQVKAIDTAAKTAGVSVDAAAAALNKLGIAAKASGDQIHVADSEVGRASEIVKRLGSDAKVTAGELEKMGGAAAKASGAAAKAAKIAPFVGPALPTTTTETAASASAAAARRQSIAAYVAERAAVLDGIKAIERRIGVLAQGAKLDATRADSVQRLIAIETGLENALKRGNLTAEQRVTLNAALARSQAAIASATTQATAASTQATTAATTQAAAVSQVGAATQKATTQVTALGTRTARTNQQMQVFGRQGRSAMLGLGFAISQMASTGEASLLSLARQITTITALLGGKLGVAGLIGAVGIGIFDFFRAKARTAGEILRDAAISQARDISSIQKASLQQDEAAQRLAFERGLTTLQTFYSQRAQIIQRGIAAEIAAKQAEIRALSTPIAGESKKDTADRLVALRKAGAEIVALRSQGLAQQIDNATALEAAERQRNETLIGFEQQRLEAQGDAHTARLRQIELEADALRRALGPAPDTDARVKRFIDAMVLQAGLAREQVGIDRLQTDLATRRLEVQNRLTANKISEEEAAREIADIERAAVPELQKLVDLAIKFAAALGDKGALASLQQLSVELKGLGVNVTALERDITQSIRQGGPSLREAARKALELVAQEEGPLTFEVRAKVEALLESGRAADAQFAELGKGFGLTLTDAIAAAASGGSGAKALLAGLGGIFQEMGKALTIYGLTMMGLLPTFSNPFTAGPAALAAGVALTALGAALGGAASGQKGGSSSFSATKATPISIDRLVVDPNAGVRQRISSAGMQQTAGASGPTQVLQVIGINTPQGQALIGTASARYSNRGG